MIEVQNPEEGIPVAYTGATLLEAIEEAEKHIIP